MKRVEGRHLLLYVSLFLIPLIIPTIVSAEESIYSDGIEATGSEVRTFQQLEGEYCERADLSIQRKRSSAAVINNSKITEQLKFFNLQVISSTDSREYCLVRTGIGVFGGDRWAVDGDLNSAVEVEIVNFIPIPSSQAIIYTSRSGRDPYGTFRMSINYNFTHGHPGLKATGGSGSPRELSRTWTPGSSASQMKYSDNTPLVVRQIRFSDNGKYGVAVLSGGLLVRINIDTQQITPVVKMSSSGRGWNIKISNDGNYILSRDANSSGLTFHDLTGCVALYDKDLLPRLHNMTSNEANADGCKSTKLASLLNDVFPGVGNIATPAFKFTPANNQFSVYAKAAALGDGYHKVTFEAVGYESSAQGYLAMGDSYASGEGDTEGGEWYEPGTDEQGSTATFEGRNLCHLSRRSYPYLLAMQLGYLQSNLETPPEDGLFHSVACSGAKMHNIIGGLLGEKHDGGTEEDFASTDNQYRYEAESTLRAFQPGATSQKSFISGRMTPDESSRPEAITIGIGGNDAGFSDKLVGCLAPGTCELATNSDARSSMIIEMLSKKDDLKNLYSEIKQASPESKIYVVGYPAFVQSAGGVCGANVHLDTEERYLMSSSTKYFNSVIKLAARETGVIYVDVQEIFQGFNLCSDAEKEDMTVNGITLGDDIRPLEDELGFLPGGLCIVRECIGNETYHPTPVGHVKYTEAMRDITNDFSVENPDPELDLRVDIPDDYFGSRAQSHARYMNGDTLTPQEIQQQRDLVKRAIDYRSLVVGGSQFYPGSGVSIEVHSTPTSLGTFTAGPDGALEASIVIPDSLEGGYHELHMTGIDAFGNPAHYYQSLMLAHAPDDFDGDGVLDSDDLCVTVFNSFIDEDSDGLDDACDNNILLAAVQSAEPLIKGQVSSETVAGTAAELSGAVADPQVLGSSVSAGTGSDTLQDTGLPVSNNVYIGLGSVLTAFALYGVGRLDFKTNKAYTKK